MSKVKAFRLLCACLAATAAIMTGGTSMRANAYSNKERLTKTVVPSKGVDLTSLPAEVEEGRASDMSNMMPRRGANQKRFGWVQVGRINKEIVNPEHGFDPYEHPRINGMWAYPYAWEGCMIVHAGDGLYTRLTREDNTEDWQRIYSGLRDCRSMAFIQDGRLFLVGAGDYVVVYTRSVGGQTVVQAESVVGWDGVYVPTTTVSINPEGSETVSRASGEPVNTLTRERINKAVGTDTGAAWYRLDGEPDAGTEVIVTVEAYDEGEEEVRTFALTNRYPSDYGQTQEYGTQLYPMNADGTHYKDGDGRYPVLGYIQGDRLQLSDEPLINILVPGTAAAPDGWTITPQDEAVDNIAVRFSCSRGYAPERVAQAGFGCFFGEDGTSWRLFAGGYPGTPECVYYTDGTAEKPTDLTYWPDVNIIRCGSSNRGVTGFSRVSDDVLAVFKQPGGMEPTVYYVTGDQLRNEDELIYKAVFRVTPGNVGDGIISRYACADLYGDPLVLTRQGVYAVRLRANVAVADRYLAERSRSVAGDLRDHDLTEAVACVYGGYYWLCVDGRCYIACADATYTPSRTQERQYEWWVLDNIPARVIAEVDGELLFGTEDGRICRISGTDGFEDVTENRFYTAEVMISDGLLYAMSGRLRAEFDADGEALMRFDAGAYELLWQMSEDAFEEGRIRTSEPEEVLKLREGERVVLDFPGNGLPVQIECTVGEIDYADGSYTLMNADTGEVVTSLSGAGWRLIRSITGAELHVREDGDGYKVYRDDSWENPIELTEPSARGGIQNVIYGSFIHRQPVRAYWYSPVSDLGSNLWAKTLLGLTVATDPGAGGAFSFGYETTRAQMMAGTRGVAGFTLHDLDFNDFGLPGIATSYTRRMNVRNFNFIIFRFRSDAPENACVLSYTMYYKYNRLIRGGL